MSKASKDRIRKSSAFNAVTDGLWRHRSKWGKFGVLVVVILAVSVIASLVTRLAVFKPNRPPLFHVALIAPMSGPNAEIGRSLREGAQLYVDDINRQGGINGGLVTLDVYNDDGDLARAGEAADSILSANKAIAVIGPWSKSAVDRAADILTSGQITMVVPSHAHPEQRRWVFSLGYSDEDETRFLANYVRNVNGDLLTSIIADEVDFGGSADLFQTTFERFGAPIRHRWNINSRAPDLANQFADLVKKVKDAKDAGTLYLAMNPQEAAGLVKALRDNQIVNKIVGPLAIGTRAFAENIGSPDVERYLNGIVTTAPLMFDTANERAQIFRSRYLSVNHSEPDWVAAYAHESMHVIGEAVRDLKIMRVSPDVRKQFRDYLATRNRADRGIAGLSGVNFFDASGVASKPIQVGIYDGRQLISALTQLQPIGRDEVGNYIQAVREGRALYVNDRFMYKTNVVYSGIAIKDIRKFDRSNATFEMDFMMWFRYRGDFQPQDVVFTNAVEPIKLGNPERTEKLGDLSYLSYRVTGKFYANFLKVPRDYGTELFGTSYRHRVLDRNNLLYVVDVIGLGLTGGRGLLDKVRDARALPASLGMVADRGWIAQDIVHSDGMGSLTFVGHGKPQPDFSQINIGLMAKRGALSLRDFVSNEYLIYIMIFALVGSFFAVVMDRKREGSQFFWNFQSWLLRAICWPLLLFSLGNLLLSFAVQKLEFYVVDMIVPIYEALWWLVPAALLTMAFERFVWRPLEQRTRRKVPGSIRAVVSIVIYLLAIFSVIAFVFNQQLTSLLATSGLMAMVIGLAVQGNIANIFSGIVLNLERPFQVGDILRLKDNTEAEVIDITWRSIRVRNWRGNIYSIPNVVATQSEMIRVIRSSGEPYKNSQMVYVPPNYEPQRIVAIIKKALGSVKEILENPSVRYVGTILSQGIPYSSYDVSYAAPEYGQRGAALEAVWSAIWIALHNEGISMVPRDKKQETEMREAV